MKYLKIDRKKKRLDSFRPLPMQLKETLEKWFRTELTWSSNGIDGNSLTRVQTALVEEKGIAVGRKLLAEQVEATNHAAAMTIAKMLAAFPEYRLYAEDMQELHRALMKGPDDMSLLD